MVRRVGRQARREPTETEARIMPGFSWSWREVGCGCAHAWKSGWKYILATVTRPYLTLTRVARRAVLQPNVRSCSYRRTRGPAAALHAERAECVGFSARPHSSTTSAQSSASEEPRRDGLADRVHVDGRTHCADGGSPPRSQPAHTVRRPFGGFGAGPHLQVEHELALLQLHEAAADLGRHRSSAAQTNRQGVRASAQGSWRCCDRHGEQAQAAGRASGPMLRYDGSQRRRGEQRGPVEAMHLRRAPAVCACSGGVRR